jgi:hypothetical protein
VAVGAYIVEDEARFLAIDSDFDADCYQADFTLFEKRKEGSYTKQHQRIQQFYHTVETLVQESELDTIRYDEITLYGFEAPDKLILILQKS